MKQLTSSKEFFKGGKYDDIYGIPNWLGNNGVVLLGVFEVNKL